MAAKKCLGLSNTEVGKAVSRMSIPDYAVIILYVYHVLCYERLLKCHSKQQSNKPKQKLQLYK